MTGSETFSRARWEILQAVAAGDPNIGVTAGPVIDTLIRDRVIECRGCDYVFTDLGRRLHDRWSQEQRYAQLPGVQVKHARQQWRCSSADQVTGFIVTLDAPGRRRQEFTLEGGGAREWIDTLRRRNPGGKVTVEDVPNPHYRPACPGVIGAGEAYAVLPGGRRVCMTCAPATLTPTPGGTP